MQLQFGPRATAQVIPHPAGELLAVRLSGGRNAVTLQLPTSVAAALRDLLAAAVQSAGEVRRLTLATQNGRPVALGDMIRRAVEGRASAAEIEMLLDFVDRSGLLQ